MKITVDEFKNLVTTLPDTYFPDKDKLFANAEFIADVQKVIDSSSYDENIDILAVRLMSKFNGLLRKYNYSFGWVDGVYKVLDTTQNL